MISGHLWKEYNSLTCFNYVGGISITCLPSGFELLHDQGAAASEPPYEATIDLHGTDWI
jgi:hypothetical protein